MATEARAHPVHPWAGSQNHARQARRRERLPSLISTGALFCAEDGNHHRPNRPAEIARDIFVSLETVAGELYKHGAEVGEAERQMMRQIHPWLPSFSSEFACSEPLTRIRNIAHRSDISEDLKKQIKHTIQNKLHRNAGPEDLVATEAFIKRITVDAHPGECPQAFVDEFMLFYDELKRFFNCSGAIERLDAMYDTFEDETRARCRSSRRPCGPWTTGPRVTTV